MELKLADLSKDVEQYLRKDIDGGILTDKFEIDRYKNEQYINVIDNLMLGNYNEFGEYILQDEIKEELLNCTKVIEDNYENILFVKSVQPINVFSYLNFAIKVINSSQAGYKVAILELLEPIYKGKGFIENTQATVIKRIEVLDNDILKQEIYKAFNVVVKIDDDNSKREKKDDENSLQNIINRKIKLLYIKQKLDMDREYEVVYKKSIEKLNETKEGKQVLEKYKKDTEIAKKCLNVKEDDYKAQSELLINSINYFPTQPIFKEIKVNFNNVNKNLIKQINNKLLELNMVKKIKKQKNIRKINGLDMLNREINRVVDILER